MNFGRYCRSAWPSTNCCRLRVPTWTRVTLANGAELVVTQKHDLPLVALSIDFIGGSYNYEPAAKLGVASFTAQMLSEGTATRSADELCEQVTRFGAEIGPHLRRVALT